MKLYYLSAFFSALLAMEPHPEALTSYPEDYDSVFYPRQGTPFFQHPDPYQNRPFVREDMVEKWNVHGPKWAVTHNLGVPLQTPAGHVRIMTFNIHYFTAAQDYIDQTDDNGVTTTRLNANTDSMLLDIESLGADILVLEEWVGSWEKEGRYFEEYEEQRNTMLNGLRDFGYTQFFFGLPSTDLIENNFQHNLDYKYQCGNLICIKEGHNVEVVKHKVEDEWVDATTTNLPYFTMEDFEEFQKTDKYVKYEKEERAPRKPRANDEDPRVATRVDVRLGNQTVSIWGLHLEARSDYSKIMQLKVVKDHIRKSGAQNYIILGDFNSDYNISPAPLKMIKKNDFVHDSFECCHANKPTITNWSGNAIDFIFVSPSLCPKVSGAYVYYTNSSDHFPVFIDLRLN